MSILKPVFIVCLLTAAALAFYFWSGAYPIGADVPHAPPVERFLAAVRTRAVAAQSRGIEVPALDDPALILEGAGQYASMCSTCHLAPGYARDETWEGLYPRPPRLAAGTQLTPAEIFWALKHGIRMSGMPAWGRTHSDHELWAITAFVVRLPGMGAQTYADLVAKAPPDDDMVRMPMPGGMVMPPGSAATP